MSSNLPAESPKHRIEFTGNAAFKKRRKPPPKLLAGWFGGVLLIVGGGAVGGYAAVASIWKMAVITDDIGSPLGFIVALLAGATIGAVTGSVVGLFIWIGLNILARKSEEIE